MAQPLSPANTDSSPLRSVFATEPNRDYVYDGVRLDLDSLFELHPVFDEAYALLDTVGTQVRAMQAMLAEPTAPDISPGAHCFMPNECRFHAHCTRDQFVPDHGIDELPRLNAQRRVELESAGIEEIRDVPADIPLTPPPRIVHRAVREKRPIVHGNLQTTLADVVPPEHYLDFETFAPAIPRFAGTRPYDPIPFLFSVHIEHDDSALGHVDYLHDHDDDPRRKIAEHLISALGYEGTICTYSGYERRVLRALAEALPNLADAFAAIETRLFDLLPVVRNGTTIPASEDRPQSRACCRCSSPKWATATSRLLTPRWPQPVTHSRSRARSDRNVSKPSPNYAHAAPAIHWQW